LTVLTSILERPSPCSLAKMYSKAFLVLVTLLLNQVKPNFGTALETPKNHGR
jgi:hypothetical protein